MDETADDLHETKGEAWSPTHTMLVQVLEERNGRVLVRLPNGSKTSVEYGDIMETTHVP